MTTLSARSSHTDFQGEALLLAYIYRSVLHAMLLADMLAVMNAQSTNWLLRQGS